MGLTAKQAAQDRCCQGNPSPQRQGTNQLLQLLTWPSTVKEACSHESRARSGYGIIRERGAVRRSLWAWKQRVTQRRKVPLSVAIRKHFIYMLVDSPMCRRERRRWHARALPEWRSRGWIPTPKWQHSYSQRRKTEPSKESQMELARWFFCGFWGPELGSSEPMGKLSGCGSTSVTSTFQRPKQRFHTSTPLLPSPTPEG